MAILIHDDIKENLYKPRSNKTDQTKILFINRLDEDWAKRGFELKNLLAYCVNKMNE
jgi:hypothetical protein